MPGPILFFIAPACRLDSFSAHQVLFEGLAYPTAEHAYQAAKFSDPLVKEQIRTAGSPWLAKVIAHTAKPKIDPNRYERKLEFMEMVFRAKLEQHEDVRVFLRMTGDATLQEANPEDAYWGIGPDGQGENWTGRIWMKIRQDLAAKAS